MTHFAFYPTTGGVESHLLELCSELVRQGHKVFALVGSRQHSPSQEVIDGVEIHRVDWMNPEAMRNRKTAAGYSPAVLYPPLRDEILANYQDFVEEHHCDVVHAHNFHHFLPEYGMALTQLRRERGLPCLLTIHEVWKEFLCEELLEQTEWDSIITVSKHVADGIRQQSPHLQNVGVLYMGINTELFSPENAAVNAAQWKARLHLDGQPVIIHPARMLPWKGVIYSIIAVEMLKKEFPDIRLIITDTNDIVDWIDELRGYKEDVLREIDQRGIADNVICRTFDYRDLPAIYANCTAVLYPTIGEEPFGLVPVEAMSCARPVIVSHSGGLIESVVDGHTGFIVPKRDAAEIAEKVALIARDQQLAQRLGAAGRRRALKHFDRRRMAQQTAELYVTALQQRSAAELFAMPMNFVNPFIMY